jgi:hypothetical protein
MSVESKNRTFAAAPSPFAIGDGGGIAPNSVSEVREANRSCSPNTCPFIKHAFGLTSGLLVRDTEAAELSSHTGRTNTYFWTATQHGHTISNGNCTLRSGMMFILGVGSGRAKYDVMRIDLNYTKTFVMVPRNGRRQ